MNRNESVVQWLRELAAACERRAVSDPSSESYHRGVAVLWRNRADEIAGMRDSLKTAEEIAAWFDDCAKGRDRSAGGEGSDPEAWNRLIAILYRARAQDIRSGMDLHDASQA